MVTELNILRFGNIGHLRHTDPPVSNSHMAK